MTKREQEVPSGRSRRLLRLLAGAGAVLALAAVLVVFWAMHTRPRESSAYADVQWNKGGRPFEITFVVVDSEERPVPDVEVRFRSNSGWLAGRTDQSGVLTLECGEPDVSEMSVDGVAVMTRPYAYWLGSPTVRDGLQVTIVLKGQRVEKVSRGEKAR